MHRLLLGIVIGVCVMAEPLPAFRMTQPATFGEWNSNTFTQLNVALQDLWNISNGRYSMDVVTADPDGSRPCSVGEMVLFDTGTDQLCVCVATTNDWNCVDLT